MKTLQVDKKLLKTSLAAALMVGAAAIVVAQPERVEAQISDCPSLKRGIEEMDRQIAANSNNKGDQQTFIEARANYVKLYNSQCLGGNTEFGGGNSGGSYSGGYSAPDPGMAALSLGLGILGNMMDNSANEAAEREQARREEAYRRQLRQEQEERERAIAEARAEAARIEAARQAKLADDRQRAATCGSFDASCGGDDYNPFAEQAQKQKLAQRDAENKTAIAACKAKYNGKDNGIGKGISPDLPACPTDVQKAAHCGLPYKPGQPNSVALLACFTKIEKDTKNACDAWTSKQDIRYRLSLACLKQERDEQIRAAATPFG